jgi:hypothetical protein
VSLAFIFAERDNAFRFPIGRLLRPTVRPEDGEMHMHFIRRVENPVPSVRSLLALCPNDAVEIFVTNDAHPSWVCVYPTSDDAFAAEHAVYITAADNAVFVAAVIGIVHLHNIRVVPRTASSVGADFGRRDCGRDGD